MTTDRSGQSRWSRRAAFLSMLALAAGPTVLRPDAASGAQAASKVKVVAFHVYAEEAEKLSIPKELEPYQKQLSKTPYKRFTVPKNEKVDLTAGKPVTLALPDGLGSAELLLEESGHVTVTVTPPKKGEPTKFRAQLPLISVFDKIKTKDGKQYLLILAKAEK